jgi:hypothetical protein
MESVSRKIWSVAIVAAALVTQAAPATAAAQEWTWPVRGRIITPYSNDNTKPYAGGMHRGIDIAAPVGAEVVAAHAGRVSYAAQLGSSGLTVAIRSSDDRYVTSYLHLGRTAVGRDQAVTLGQKLGEVGRSGTPSATEPHLHFGVRLADRDRFYLDPLSLLPPLAGGVRDAPPARAPQTAPLRVQPAPAPAAVRPLAVGAPRARPIGRLPVPGMPPSPRRAPNRKPVGSGRPLPGSAISPRRSPSAGGLPARAAPKPAAGSVPAGPRLPAVEPPEQSPMPAPVAGRALEVPAANWGKPVSLAGIALLAAALIGRRSRTSRTARRQQRPQPGPRAARRVQAPVARPVSQMS